MAEVYTAVDGLRSSASLQPHILDGIFAQQRAAMAPPAVMDRLVLGLPFSRRDAAGASFVSYQLRAIYSDGSDSGRPMLNLAELAEQCPDVLLVYVASVRGLSLDPHLAASCAY